MNSKRNCKEPSQSDNMTDRRMLMSSDIFDKLIWGIDEVCRFTSYSKGTIYNLVSEGDIPYRKSRGKLKFIPSEILKWIKGEL